jgi:SH3 domain protein
MVIKRNISSKVVLVLIGIFLFLPAESSMAQGENEFPFKAEVTEGSVNLRAGYNQNFTSLKKLKKGEEVVVIDRYFSWYQVMLPADVFSYVHKDYIDNSHQVTANRLNVRAGPGSEYHILAKLKRGQRVKVLSESGNWYKIVSPPQASGWIHEDFLQKTADLDSIKITEVTIADNELSSSQNEFDDLKEDIAALQEEAYRRLPDIEAQKLGSYTLKELQDIKKAYNDYLSNYPDTRQTEELKYKINLLNIQENNKKEKMSSKEASASLENEITISGTLRDLGRIIGTDATHKLKIDGKTKYYLKSDSINLDKYIFKQVELKGLIEDASSRYPLIYVEKIKEED